MLDELTAENLGLIAAAEVQLAPGLTVITGETGTGKTLLLGALRLLRGDQARKGVIGPAGDRATVSARFFDDGDEHVVRRTVSAGRSRAYLDGSAATAADLAGALADRVAIVGQHDQLTITASAGVRRLLDRRLDPAGREARDRYDHAWSRWTSVRREADDLGDVRSLERERDTLAYQIEEIESVGIDPDSDVHLRDRVIALRNVDSVLEATDRAVRALGADGMEPALEEAVRALREASTHDPAARDLAERAETLAGLVHDLGADIARHATSIENDPSELGTLEERLHRLSDLMRKYGDSIEDVVTFGKEAAGTLDDVRRRIGAAADIDERLAAARTGLEDAGSDLRDARRRAAGQLSDEALTHLGELGFTDPVLQVEVEPAEPSRAGADTAAVRFASSADLTPGPISSIASGGELSRLVLALTLAAGSGEATTLAFDEIDAGIGGTTALAMGAKLAGLGRERQVVCVSHLPQVAAHADLHLRVVRSGSTATVEALTDDAERIAELTRMLSGLEGSKPSSGAASELLEHARRG